jgi:hypothetical protein
MVPHMTRPQKITFAEMRDTGVRGLLIYCSDYKCSQRQVGMDLLDRNHRK